MVSFPRFSQRVKGCAYSSMVRHSRRDTVDVKMLGCLIVPKANDLIRAVEVMQL